MTIEMTTPVSWTDGLGSFAAICAKYTGHITNWTHVLPSPESAQAAWDALPADMKATMADRAARHGLEGWELVQKVPQVLWEDPTALAKWLEIMDISHVIPTSVDPSKANDAANWTWELSGINRSRGAETMTGAEFRTANEAAGEAAGAPFWEFNNMLRGFMDAATLTGYTAVWLPKEEWKSIMASLKQLWIDLGQAKTFGQKLKIARLFAERIVGYVKRKGSTLTAAFLLGALTFMWPAAQWFVVAWGVVGLLAIFVSVLRKGLHYGSGNPFIKAIAELFDAPLLKLFHFTTVVRNFLDKVKDGIYNVAHKVVEVAVTTVKEVAKLVQPKVAEFIENAMTQVKKAVKTFVSAAKRVFSGFMSWVGSLFSGPKTAIA